MQENNFVTSMGELCQLQIKKYIINPFNTPHSSVNHNKPMKHYESSILFLLKL